MSGLEQDFRALLVRAGVEAPLADRLWGQVLRAYSQRGRYYHAMEHLHDLHAQLLPLRAQMQDADAVLLALVYHDIVYRIGRSDNESQSAEHLRATVAKHAFQVPTATLERAVRHILATKSHNATSDPDTDLFTDADLSVLGATPERYQRYAEDIRKEFRLYPDLLYKPGRRKVLKHFLGMDRIYRSTHFHDRLEDQARRNLAWELEVLG